MMNPKHRGHAEGDMRDGKRGSADGGRPVGPADDDRADDGVEEETERTFEEAEELPQEDAG